MKYIIDGICANAEVTISLENKELGTTYYTKWDLNDDDAMKFNDRYVFKEVPTKEEVYKCIKQMFEDYVEDIMDTYLVSDMIGMGVYNERLEDCYTNSLKEINERLRRFYTHSLKDKIEEELESIRKDTRQVLLDDLEWDIIEDLDVVISEYEIISY